MHISRLSLHQFRNYTNATYEFSPQVTVIVGPNGSGKTNILEAIHIVMTGKSFRDSDEYLVNHGEDWWKLHAETDIGSREVRYQHGEKSFMLRSKPFKRMSRQETVPVVLFEPDHLQLVHGSPGGRRKFLDQYIAQLVPGYATTLRRYERVLAQRNRLLKKPQLDQDELFVWDVSMVELARVITRRRQEQLRIWNDQIGEEYECIAGRREIVTIVYSELHEDDQQYAQALISGLRNSFNKDRTVGSTTHGPHRDDYSFYLNGHDMILVASRGEIRTLLLALKYIEAMQLEEAYSTSPLLLFDDVFSELDEKRQQQLLRHSISNQIIITTTHGNLDHSSRCIKLE